MKFKDIVIVGAALVVAYHAGKTAGHSECLRQFMDKYGDDILEKHGEIITNVSKHIMIKVTKAK